MSDYKAIRQEIIQKTIEYYQAKFAEPDFVPGKSKVNYAGRVFDHQELVNAVEASLDFWLTEGRFSEEFAEKIGQKLTNKTKSIWYPKLVRGINSNKRYFDGP